MAGRGSDSNETVDIMGCGGEGGPTAMRQWISWDVAGRGSDSNETADINLSISVRKSMVVGSIQGPE